MAGERARLVGGPCDGREIPCGTPRPPLLIRMPVPAGLVTDPVEVADYLQTMGPSATRRAPTTAT